MIAHVNFQIKIPVVKFGLHNLVFDFENYITPDKSILDSSICSVGMLKHIVKLLGLLESFLRMD